MNISILPGSTCAVIQIKIKAYYYGSSTKFKILYKKSSDSSYTETDEVNFYSNGKTYGYGPIFYDLMNLEPNTTYNIKLVVTESAYYIDNERETSVKTFTTCSLGNFEFGNIRVISTSSGNTLDDLEQLCNWFKNNMISVGCDYTLSSVYPKIANVHLDEDYCRRYNAAGLCGDTTISLRAVNNNFKSTLVHEYRHFLGLNYGAILYYDKNPDVDKVVGFCRGCNEMKLYMYYRENAVDSKYIPGDGGPLLGFFLLKALGNNSITIVY